MKDVSREERWSVELVQATRLADQNALADGVAHTQSVLNAIEATLREEGASARLERLRVRAQRQFESLEEELAAFRAKGAAMSKARRDEAAAEMQWKIPEL